MSGYRIPTPAKQYLFMALCHLSRNCFLPFFQKEKIYTIYPPTKDTREFKKTLTKVCPLMKWVRKNMTAILAFLVFFFLYLSSHLILKWTLIWSEQFQLNLIVVFISKLIIFSLHNLIDAKVLLFQLNTSEHCNRWHWMQGLQPSVDLG